MWSQLGIRNKTLLLFFIITVFPLLVVNVIWLRSSQSQLRQAAADRQSILISGLARRVNDSLDTKISGVIANSQDTDIVEYNLDAAKLSLLQYSNQESDVVRIALTDREGNELIAINEGVLSSALTNVKDTPAFQVVTFVSNKPYISNVGEVNGEPRMTVSVPILSLNSQLGDQDLTSSQALTRRFGGDISGALIVELKLNSIWDAISTVRLGEDGYAYLINNEGSLLVHPDEAFALQNSKVTGVGEVSSALDTLRVFDLERIAESYVPSPEVGISEKGEEVLSSNFPISSTKWAIIGEEPVTSVYRAANRATLSALLIFVISAPVAFTLVLFASRTIIRPIQELTQGALRISSGDFSRLIHVPGKDELSILAKAFNTMGSSVNTLLERLRSQNFSLSAEQAKLQAVLDTIADGVIVLDLNRNIVLTNKTMASFVGARNSSVLKGRPWLDVFTLYYEDELFTNELLLGDTAYFHDVQMRVNDQQRYIDITAIRILNDPNGIVFILTVQDTTPRRELENMKLDFVSMAAHELRTPLTAISGYLKLINEGDTTEDERASFITLATTNANMLEGLINNMLSLSRIERNALVIHKKRIDWSKLVREEVQSLQFTATSRNITIRMELPQNPLLVEGDEVALREVLANLINNAIHYSDDNQEIMVTAELIGTAIKTTVSDHGIGIPERLHGKLFTKYYRAKGGLTTNSQGTGIGLFISKSIIEAHGGKIGFDSTFGQGSDFYFVIDAYNENQDRQPDNNNDSMNERGNGDWIKENSHS